MQLQYSKKKKTGLEYESSLEPARQMERPDFKIENKIDGLRIERPAKDHIEIMDKLERQKKIADIDTIKLNSNLAPLFITGMSPLDFDESAKRILMMDPAMDKVSKRHKRFFS